MLLLVLAAAMMLPAAVDLAAGNPDWKVFATSTAVTAFVGAALVLAFRGSQQNIGIRESFLFTVLIWIVAPAFGALPLTFADIDMSYTDAFFEAMSGITTTGSTVMTDIESAAPGILLWRSILQWLGGVGIVIMAITLLPMLRVGGMQVFRIEAFDTPEKVLPRATSLAATLSIIYIALTAIWAVMYLLAGMSGFDAVNHAMTTIATGGYSTRDASIGAFNSPAIEWIAVAGMIVGAIPFLLYFQALRGEVSMLLTDSQVVAFLGTVLFFAAAMTAWVWLELDFDFATAIRKSAFSVISIMTGTGYSAIDYTPWGDFPTVILFCVMFVGGCAGSTSCGVKIFRFQILYIVARTQLQRLLHPHRVLIPTYNRRPLEEGVGGSVMAFFFLYAFAVIIIALLLSATGLDFITALSGAATAVSNVGPGLGETIGPAGTFASLPDTAKWVMCIGMLLGRLELFTILVLLLPSFWRQ